MGKNEKNKDARIATSSRGFKNSEDRDFFLNLRIENHVTEDLGKWVKPKIGVIL